MRLEAVLNPERVAVYGVTVPEHRLALALDGADQAWEVLTALLRPHNDDDGEAAWDVVRVHLVASPEAGPGCTCLTPLPQVGC